MRSTRLALGLTGGEIGRSWRTSGLIEIDFFGSYNGTGPYSAEQPQPRLRSVYADLSNGRTTVRFGQAFTPLFGLVPASVSHVAFPLGFGSAGIVGWRDPGVFVTHRLTGPKRATTVQLQVAAVRGGWVGAGNVSDQLASGAATPTPQLEARLDVAGRLGRWAKAGNWSTYVVAHYDEKALPGTGADTARLHTLAGRAAEAGGRVVVSRLTLQGNAWTGRAIGQALGTLSQFGDIRGWGGWAQAGWAITRQVSVWAFQGVDDPNDHDVARDVVGASATAQGRARNASRAALLRYSVGPYALGAEWMRSATRWTRAGAARPAGFDTVRGNQLALSVLYTF